MDESNVDIGVLHAMSALTTRSLATGVPAVYLISKYVSLLFQSAYQILLYALVHKRLSHCQRRPQHRANSHLMLMQATEATVLT
jgi:hypothetical protein